MDYSKLTDKQLIDRIIDNDTFAAAHLIRCSCAKLLSYIRNDLFRNTYIEVDDLASELYLFLSIDHWQKLKEFQYRSKLTTWISVVAHRYFLKKYKSLVIDKSNFEPLNTEWGNSIRDNAMDGYFDKVDLLDAIQKMPNPVYKRVLYLLEIEGYEPEEVAKIVSTTVSNVYNIRSRAKKELKSVLNEDRNYGK